MATPQPKLGKQKRLFQSNKLTALFGPTRAKMVTRIVVVLAAVGTLAIITAGLLQPTTPPTASSNTSTSTHPTQAPVGLLVGEAAPNFTLSTPGGKKVSLSDYRGKPVMLNFWYGGCSDCLAEIPGMQKYYASQQVAGKAFVILGVNSVDDASTTTRIVQGQGLTYPVVLDQNQRVETLYKVNGTPISYFIDRQGIIRSIVIGPVDDTALRQNVALISS